MMKERRSKQGMLLGLAMVMVVSMSMLGNANGTTFQECYIPCYILCAIQPTHTLSYCAFECLRDCIIPTNLTKITTQQHHDHANGNDNGNANAKGNVTPFQFCNFGCASTHCLSISTPNNPRGKEVEGCVKSCAGTCRKGYVAP